MRCLLVSAIVLVAGTTSAEAILMGQLDDFQSGTSEGWGGWYNVSVQNISNGGPYGSGDRYFKANLLVGSSDEQLLFYNSNQWSGNYATAKVSMIEIDLRNTNPMALEVYMMIDAANYGDFTSFQAITLPPDGQWHHVTFSLLEKDMTWGGQALGLYDSAIRYVDWLGIGFQAIDLSGMGCSFPLNVELGIDNIHALPEPSSYILLLVLALAGRKTRRALSF